MSAALRVLVHADDLGLSERVNEAVVEALVNGVVSSASLLANGPAFEHALKLLVGVRAPDIGLHLNLSEFEPLLPLGELAPLFPDGRLGPGALGAERRHLDGVVREWLAQVERARAAGLALTHLDSHQHLHWRPLFLTALRRVAERTGIRRARGMGAFRPGVDPARAALQRLRAARFRRALRDGDPPIVSTDHFANASVFRALCEGGARLRGSIEVMTHPGNPASPRYADELAWLRGPWAREAPWPVERISWRQLS